MPLVRISIRKGQTDEYVSAIADGIHQAMIATIGIPEGDRFQIITEHEPRCLIADRHYLDVSRSDEIVIVNITMKSGRTVEMKRSLYRQAAQNLGSNPGLRAEDVMIVLSENEPEDWSFGNGHAQLLQND